MTGTEGDEVVRHSIERWDALARAGAVLTRPWLDLDARTARQRLDPEGWLGELGGARVLLLAGGGGQQSAAYALLGAHVTVLDLSRAQLARDREAAAHHGTAVETVRGDMRDLSCLGAGVLDLVHQPYSLNLVPDPRAVFAEVARVLRPGGLYHLVCANPATHGLSPEDWDGRGYGLRRPCVDGAEVAMADPPWVFRGERPAEPVPTPREWRHTLFTLLAGLAERGFGVLAAAEEHFGEPDPEAPPGTMAHLTSIAPPWLALWARARGLRDEG
jgi:SAM-dependent methyltransferase